MAVESIKAFQDLLTDIYGKKNSERSFEYVYSYLCRNSSYLSRSILRSGDSTTFFMRSFSWLFAISTHSDIDLETAFRKKFPLVCPYCLAASCVCSETHRTPHNMVPIHALREELKEHFNTDTNNTHKLPIDDAVNRIAKIYPANKAIWSAFGSFYHFSRLYEEIGEIHEAYTATQRGKPKTSLEEELADVAAWLFSAWHIHTEGASLKDALLDYYLNGCPVCHNHPCNCTDYADRAQAISDPERLSQLVSSFRKFSSLTNEQKAIDQVIASLEAAIESSSTQEAKIAVSSAEILLEKIKRNTGLLSGIAQDARNIASSIGTLDELLTGLRNSF